MPTEKSMERAREVHAENCCMKFAGEKRMTEAIATAIDEAVAEKTEQLLTEVDELRMDVGSGGACMSFKVSYNEYKRQKYSNPGVNAGLVIQLAVIEAASLHSKLEEIRARSK